MVKNNNKRKAKKEVNIAKSTTEEGVILKKIKEDAENVSCDNIIDLINNDGANVDSNNVNITSGEKTTTEDDEIKSLTKLAYEKIEEEIAELKKKGEWLDGYTKVEDGVTKTRRYVMIHTPEDDNVLYPIHLYVKYVYNEIWDKRRELEMMQVIMKEDDSTGTKYAFGVVSAVLPENAPAVLFRTGLFNPCVSYGVYVEEVLSNGEHNRVVIHKNEKFKTRIYVKNVENDKESWIISGDNGKTIIIPDDFLTSIVASCIAEVVLKEE